MQRLNKLSKIIFYRIPLVLLIATSPVLASNILNISDERLDVKISADLMNRIAVVNDRIVNVFGDEGTFVVQTDEHTGQVFIKPTPENEHKPLSITIITENGITQDLTLTPTKVKAATLVLKPQQNIRKYNADNLLPGFSGRNQSIQEQLIQLMKQAVLGELAVLDLKRPPSRKINGFNVNYVKSYQASNYLIQVWLIKNTSKNLQELQEKTFFKSGDLALSLQKRLLPANDKTYLYILGNS